MIKFEERNMENRKLYKSRTDKKLDGVCAGVASYFNIDPTLVRVGWAILSLFAFIGVIAYIVCAIIIPREP